MQQTTLISYTAPWRNDQNLIEPVTRDRKIKYYLKF